LETIRPFIDSVDYGAYRQAVLSQELNHVVTG
jgi:hypothetical protein